MILINLLPHREEKRRRRRQAFFMGLGAAALAGAAIALGWNAVLGELTAQQNSRNTFLQSEIQRLENQIKDIASLKTEIEALKADPGAVSWAGGSAGGTDHIAVGLIAKAAGVDGLILVAAGAGGHAGTGRKDDVAGPEEQGKGHETEGKNVPGLEFFHTLRLRRAALARLGAMWNQGKLRMLSIDFWLMAVALSGTGIARRR